MQPACSQHGLANVVHSVADRLFIKAAVAGKFIGGMQIAVYCRAATLRRVF
jgi:hypothetical protein